MEEGGRAALSVRVCVPISLVVFSDLLSRAFLSTSTNELCTRILLALTGQ